MRERGLLAAIEYCKSNIFMKLNQNLVKENLNSAFSRSQKYPRFQLSSKLSAGTVLPDQPVEQVRECRHRPPKFYVVLFV